MHVTKKEAVIDMLNNWFDLFPKISAWIGCNWSKYGNGTNKSLNLGVTDENTVL